MIKEGIPFDYLSGELRHLADHARNGSLEQVDLKRAADRLDAYEWLLAEARRIAAGSHENLMRHIDAPFVDDLPWEIEA